MTCHLCNSVDSTSGGQCLNVRTTESFDIFFCNDCQAVWWISKCDGTRLNLDRQDSMQYYNMSMLAAEMIKNVCGTQPGDGPLSDMTIDDFLK